MRKFALAVMASWQVVTLCAQEAAPTPTGSGSTPASAADVEALRQQVQSLTELVKTLQQQVKDQQATMEKGSAGQSPALPQNREESAVATRETSPAPNAAPPQLFPTEDSSVVAAPRSAPSSAETAVTPDGMAQPGAFPTTDSSVVTSTEPSSIVSGGSSLTAPITIGGGKNYMNISFDGLFAISTTLRSATTIRSSAASMRATSSSHSMARSIRISKDSPTLFSSWTTTIKPRWKLKRRFCRQRICRLIFN